MIVSFYSYLHWHPAFASLFQLHGVSTWALSSLSHFDSVSNHTIPSISLPRIGSGKDYYYWSDNQRFGSFDNFVYPKKFETRQKKEIRALVNLSVILGTVSGSFLCDALVSIPSRRCTSHKFWAHLLPDLRLRATSRLWFTERIFGHTCQLRQNLVRKVTFCPVDSEFCSPGSLQPLDTCLLAQVTHESINSITQSTKKISLSWQFRYWNAKSIKHVMATRSYSVHHMLGTVHIVASKHIWSLG